MRKLWTLNEVRDISPLIKSILATIRERYLAEQNLITKIKKLSGQSSRNVLIQIQELAKQAETEHIAVESAVEELNRLEVLVLDPVDSQALFLFSKCSCKTTLCNPAWFVYSPLGERIHWRYDTDDMATRRDVDDLGDDNGLERISRSRKHRAHPKRR